jgi:hypothetical protein
MPTEIVGSREKEFASEQSQVSTRGYGQNGYQGPSSVTPGKGRAISKTYAGLATDTMNVSVKPGDFQTRTVSSKQYATTPGMKKPDASAKVPTSLNRGSVKPSTVPAKRGNAKR